MRQRVAAELRERGAHVKDEWLQSCLDHIRSEEKIDVEGGSANLQRVVNAVFQHVLTTDLKHIVALGSLPDVAKMHKQTLQGSHLLQIDEMVNIEEPVANLSRIHDEDEEKALEKKQKRDVRGAPQSSRWGNQQQQSAHRTFKLSLTDGVRKVFGLEYRRLYALDAERTPPGTKIVVRDVLVRRGMLLLIPQNVQVLGGRVEDLIEASTRAMNLKRKRGQDQGEDEMPASSKEINKRPHAGQQRVDSASTLPSPPPPQGRIQQTMPKLRSFTSAPSENSASAFSTTLVPIAARSQPTTTSVSTSSTPSTSTSSTSNSAVYIPFFSKPSGASASSKPITTSRLSPPTPPGTNDSTESIEDDDMGTMRVKSEDTSTDLKLLPVHAAKKIKEEANPVQPIYLLDEEPSNIAELAPMHEAVQEDFGFCLGDLPEFSDVPDKDLPFVYIDQIEADLKTGRIVTIKAASIELLKGSFQYKNNGKFSLELKLEDGSGTLQALMSDEVVSQLIGISCAEFNANLSRGADGVNENKRRMRMLEVALFGLEGLMEVALEDPKPIIRHIYPPTTEHIDQLYGRVSYALPSS